MLTKRLIDILTQLIYSDSPILIEDLADYYKVSVRTIQNELDAIDLFLARKKMPVLNRQEKGKAGIELGFGDAVKEIISGFNTTEYFFLLDDRLDSICLYLIMEDRFITIAQLTDYFLVSRGTIINDLNKLKGTLSEYGLEIESSNRFGIRLTGNEFDKRQFAKQKMMEQYHAFEVDYILKVLMNHNMIAAHLFKYTSSNESAKKIKESVDSLEIVLETKLSDRTYVGLILYLHIMVNRSKEGRQMQTLQSVIDDLFTLREYQVVKDQMQNLAEYFQFSLIESEVIGVLIQFLGGNTWDSVIDKSYNYAEIQVLVFDLIHQFSDIMEIPLYSDIQVIKKLLVHIKALVFRIKFGLQLDNPLLEDIKIRYADIFKAVKEIIKGVEEYAGGRIKEGEIGFLVLYFAILINEYNETTKVHVKPKVLVVCNFGFGTVSLLVSRLKSLYDIEIVASISLNRLEETAKMLEFDLIVSTIKIPKQYVQCIVVDALLSDKNIHMLDRIFQRKQKFDVDAVIKLMERHGTIENVKGLKRDLKQLLNTNDLYTERISLPMLKDVIKPELIHLDYEAKNWEDAVRRSGEVLKQYGYIQDSYIQSMVDTVKKMGPYIVIGKGIALPHSRSMDDVKKIGISLIRLKSPIEFGNENNDPVTLVFGLCSTDNSSHLLALKGLANLLNDPDNVKYLNEEKDIYELIEFIKRKDV